MEPIISHLYEVSLTQGASGMFPVGVVLHNRAVEHNMVMFSELSPGGERPAKASITSNSASLSSC